MAKEKKPSDKLADKTALTKFLQGVFGDAQKRILKKLWKRAQEIGGLESKYEKMSDKELKLKTDEFKKKIDGGGEIFDSADPLLLISLKLNINYHNHVLFYLMFL